MSKLLHVVSRVKSAGFLVSGLMAMSAMAAPQALTNCVVAAGETLEIASVGSGDPITNSVHCLIDLRAGATLKLKKSTVDTMARLWSSLIVTNGAATVEIAGEDTALSFYNNTIVRSPLTIKGAGLTQVNFWDQDAKNKTRTTSCAQYDFSGGITYEDGQGGTITPTCTISDVTTAYMTLMSRPPDTYQFKAGASFPIAGTNYYDGVSEITYDSDYAFKATLLTTNTVTHPQKFRLATEYRSVYMSPNDVPDFASTHDKTWTPIDGEYDFDVEFGHSGAVLYFESISNITYRGTVTGPGQIIAQGPAVARASKYRCFGNLAAFTGVFKVKNYSNFVLDRSVGNDIRMDQFSTLAFERNDGDVSSITLGKVTSSATITTAPSILVAEGQTITIGTLVGVVRLGLAEGATSGTFYVTECAADAVLLVDDGVTVTFNGASNPSRCIRFVPEGSTQTCYLLPDENGFVTLPTSPKPMDPRGYVSFGGVSVSGLPAGYGIVNGDSNSATLLVDAAATTATYAAVPAGASANVAVKIAPWRTEAMLWIDPSIESTHCQHYKETGSGTSRTEDKTSPCKSITISPDSNCKVVRGLTDTRVTDAPTLRMWNARPWMRKTYYEEVNSTVPYIGNSCAPADGLAYLAFGNCDGDTSRRIQFVDYDGVTDDYQTYGKKDTISPRFVIMVYGSQKGGGYSIIGTGSARIFARTNSTDATALKALKANDPIMLSNPSNVVMWLNGASIDPTKTGLSGEWDIISIDLSNVSSISGFGTDGAMNGKDGGGKYLGETIFLSSVPDDATRRDIEKYLANRWKIDYHDESVPAPKVQLGGAGSVSIAETSAPTLSGAFSGTLNLAAGVSATLTGTTPYAESEIDSLNPAFWIDPSAEGVMTYFDRALQTVYNVMQHNPSKRTIGKNLYLTSNGNNRAPIAISQARGLGSVRTWIDYNGTNETTSTQGNTLRVRCKSTADTPVKTQMGFIVQDSVRGGGTPFIDNIHGSGSVAKRLTTQYTTAIYSSSTKEIFRESPVYLNGTKVAQADGFTGRPELFTFTASSVTNVGYFAYYGNSESGKRQGEIQGEILLFADKLEDGPRSRVEAYLMKKWLGWMPAGFTDYTDATLAGAGTLTVDDLAKAPRMSADFSGTLNVTTCESIAMTMVRGDSGWTVDGAIVAENATLALPSAVTVNVNSESRPRSGRYTLIKAASLGETTFTLGGNIEEKFSGAKLENSNGTLTLVLPPPGAVLILK